jgi:glycyl-tRNA synthetase beta chain
MNKAADFLVEIGTEELPPKALRNLMTAFADHLTASLDGARLLHGAVHAYASPRRLAVLIENLALAQDDRKVLQQGPPVSVAYTDDGEITAAGTAFAKKCGIPISDLRRTQSAKGERLVAEIVETGQPTSTLVAPLIEKSLAALPIPRRMRWGEGEAEFVRPVHWIVLLHGRQVIAEPILGVAAGNETRGHRFHAGAAITIREPADYLPLLQRDGYVIADFERRRELVQHGVESQAKLAGGHVVDGESLYDEVTALVEWPVPITGRFDGDYLELPREVVVSTLTSHQRYFPVADDDGRLLPLFITVANLESREPDRVRDGNERVIRPRLADAAFFWDSDRRTTLAARKDALREVVYQRGLGSLFDKSARTAALATRIARELDVTVEDAAQAAALSKCDLLTGMVGEFPELQGTMGRYYAQSDGEARAVCDAIGEQYLPRFSGDQLPVSMAGRVLAVSDKLDTLAGIFAIGKKPSGNRDPFGLRRAALGLLRILIECELDLDLRALLDESVALQPVETTEIEQGEALYDFITERLRRYFLDRDATLATETFDAVLARRPASLVDFEKRLTAVQAFCELEPASSLAAANKRIANILRQAGNPELGQTNKRLLHDPAELALWSSLGEARRAVVPLLEAREYTEALTTLAGLRELVDRFFDDVMVMVEDEALRNNRLALLGELRALFLDVADISRLSIA